MALRGNGDESDSYFIQMMKLRGEDDFKLVKWMNALKVQLETLHTSRKGIEPTLTNVFDFFRELSNPMRCMFSEAVTLVKLIMVMPATNATSE